MVKHLRASAAPAPRVRRRLPARESARVVGRGPGDVRRQGRRSDVPPLARSGANDAGSTLSSRAQMRPEPSECA